MIIYGNEEMRKFRKDGKRNYKETSYKETSNNKEINKEIIPDMYQPKSILKKLKIILRVKVYLIDILVIITFCMLSVCIGNSIVMITV
ncbi:MAG: hypothetical protein F9K48_00285 [Candidatus Brocadia sp.]|nr:MAG: hypothetical protein F9K48_00285 [Candidatus Brocadia sp.]